MNRQERRKNWLEGERESEYVTLCCVVEHLLYGDGGATVTSLHNWHQANPTHTISHIDVGQVMAFAYKLSDDLWSSPTFSVLNGSSPEAANLARRAARRTFYRAEHDHISEEQAASSEG